MSEMIKLWQTEHAHFGRLLALLERELATYHEGGEPNYDLMNDVVFYLKHYGDQFHHPREDVAFARLVERDATLAGRVKRLTQEHRVIDAHGNELLERLSQTTQDTMAPRDRLESAAATYLVYYRHHLLAEERDILPRAEELLDAADWDAIARAVPQAPDPLFGDDPAERFRELRRQIVREAG